MGCHLRQRDSRGQKQAIKDALKPLLDLRKSQAGDLFKVFDERTGTSKVSPQTNG